MQRKTCFNFPGKQRTKVVWPLLEARTQPHRRSMCKIAATRGFWEEEQRPTEKEMEEQHTRRHQEIPTEDMTQNRKYWMTKILAGPVEGDGQEM